MTRLVGITNRNMRDNPVRHIFTYMRASQHGRNYMAPCGTSIRPWPLTEGETRVEFDTDHPRTCGRCKTWLGSRSPSVPA